MMTKTDFTRWLKLKVSAGNGTADGRLAIRMLDSAGERQELTFRQAAVAVTRRRWRFATPYEAAVYETVRKQLTAAREADALRYNRRRPDYRIFTPAQCRILDMPDD